MGPSQRRIKGVRASPLSRMAQPMGAVMAGGLLLSFFAGEQAYMIVVLAICACGLIFAKYLSEYVAVPQ